MIAKSKRGAKQLKRHGNVWVPIAAERQVPCLGMKPGIRLMSIQDRATFWMAVENDPNLQPVERLDNFGQPMRDRSEVSLGELIEQGQRKMGITERVAQAVDQQVLNGEETLHSDTRVQKQGEQPVISEYSTVGVTSGRTRASGGPNETRVPHDHPADQPTQEQAAARDAA
jgi:hypothetical protein